MGAKSGIEWTDATWNPVRARLKSGGSGAARDNRERARALAAGTLTGWHCEHVSEGCRNCYAEGINKRLGTKLDFKPGHLGKIDIFLDEKLLTDPLRWKKPRSVFVSSMTDVFADFVSDEMLDRMFAVMALASQHFFRMLTKRGERMRDYVSHAHTAARVTQQMFEVARERGTPITRESHPELYDEDGFATRTVAWPLPNAGLGVSVEDQASADERIPHLLATPAAMRFVSCEPLLGPVILEEAWHGESALNSECWGECGWCVNGLPPLHNCYNNLESLYTDRSGLDEVICGGESGAHARPMHPDWARSLRDQCADAGVPFFFKQWGEWLPWEPEQGPCWKSQNGRSEDSHNLFPTDFDSQTRWNDGLDHVADGEGQAAFERVGKKAAGAALDGREHREVAAQVAQHFERLAPHPKNPADFSTSPQGGGDGGGEAGA
ncbi:MAG: phage Gp37/Gp68 family protein [Parvibaculum sp.]|uniref:phage Gp37/Gp68 family protein n=1 Tax=Parvibaculum sp. TaxID=2024848 RepID=UPI002AB835EA|nr:phage Gp37/Gp68 family protein [Parvibaculum sp.]MDZ4382829.1 phage Gp37/Gp68 family protein [Parvibaculum sp.]